ncbi:MAG: hypothetical protein IK115_06920 [Lachnospiraceae bacterium]|nr:hypothetical protein [Lachnospiraceae bacterium]
MAKKKLIMGVVKKYWWYKIEPFFISCSRYNGGNCDIVAFTKDLSAYTRDKLKEYHIHSVEIPDRYEHEGPIDYRYGLYIDILEKKGARYDQVLFCDTRDVFFQKALFPEDAGAPYLGVAVESGLIGGDDWNRRWMQERFGEEAYEELKDKHVLCAGTIWGSSEVIHDFCNAMIDNLSDPQYNFIDINDQTSYQYMVYHQLVPKNAETHFSTLSDGPVATIGNEGDYRIDGELLRCPEDGDNIPALVHQWDRHKALYPFVAKHFREKHPRIRWKRYKDYQSLKDIALTSYHNRQPLNMLIASVKYFFANKPAGEHLWKWN